MRRVTCNRTETFLSELVQIDGAEIDQAHVLAGSLQAERHLSANRACSDNNRLLSGLIKPFRFGQRLVGSAVESRPLQSRLQEQRCQNQRADRDRVSDERSCLTD